MKLHGIPLDQGDQRSFHAQLQKLNRILSSLLCNCISDRTSRQNLPSSNTLHIPCIGNLDDVMAANELNNQNNQKQMSM